MTAEEMKQEAERLLALEDVEGVTVRDVRILSEPRLEDAQGELIPVLEPGHPAHIVEVAFDTPCGAWGFQNGVPHDYVSEMNYYSLVRRAVKGVVRAVNARRQEANDGDA